MHLDPFPRLVEGFGGSLQLLDGKKLKEVRVFHMGAGAIVEEIPQQDTTRRLIGLDAGKAPKCGVRRMRGLGQLIFDALRMDSIAALHCFLDRELAVMVFGQRESHLAFEGQFARTELLDDLRSDTGKPETPPHQVNRDAEFQRDFVFTAALGDHLVEGFEMVGGVHRRALEVFRGRVKDGVTLVFD